MKQKSSSQKGDEFEIRVFELINDLLQNNEWFVPGKVSKIFWKKAYYSEKRKSNITFDITIETFIPGAERYSLLTIIECKNLNHKVSVDDVEEFNSKISQIGEHNTKGIMIAANTFQEGAYQYGKSQGVGMARLTTSDKLDWINFRKEKPAYLFNPSELKLNFTEELTLGEKFIATANNKGFNNFADLLLELGIIDRYNHKEKYFKIPFLTDKRVNEIVNKLIGRGVYTQNTLDIEKLCNFLSSVYPVSFELKEILPQGILGKIEFNPFKISVSASLKDDLSRWRFTLAHEVGHLILHSKLLCEVLDAKTDTELSLSLKHSVSDATNRRLEYQANIFASNLLIPVEFLTPLARAYFQKENIKKGYLYLDHQPVNQQLVFTFLHQISTVFQVSLEVAKIRMVTLGLLEDTTDNSLRAIFKRMELNRNI